MAQESEIDATVPADNVQVAKADVRANFSAAQQEINQLFVLTSYPWLMVRNGLSRSNF